jgi:helicase MOV-10
MDSDKLYRFTAPFPHEEDGSEDLQTSLSHERLLSFRVVVSTCSEAGILQDLDVPVGHFSHVVIDEAAQAEEPLVMIPIVTFSNAYTNIILAGDPHQLGPMIKSPTAARSGLGKSYFERLMRMRDIYGTGDTQVGKP